MPEKYYSYYEKENYPTIVCDTFENKEPIVTGYTYMTDNYVFSTVNRSCLWNQRRPFTVYWKGFNSTNAFMIKFLHDGYDYSSSAIYTQQKENKSVSVINLYTGGGDKHIGIDKIKNGLLKASDLRVRFLVNGKIDSAKQLSIDSAHNKISLVDNGLKFELNLCYADFDGNSGKWELTYGENDTYIDYVIYKGKEKLFNLNDIKTAGWGITFSINDIKDNSSYNLPIIDYKNNVLKIEWEELCVDKTTLLENLGTYPLAL